MSSEDIEFLKEQSKDLLKIVGVVGLGAISSIIPIALEKLLNKRNMSMMPSSQRRHKEDPHTGEDLTEGRRKKRRKTKRKLKEDVFTKKEFDREFVEKQISDLTNKEIPNLEALRESNPILIRKVTALRDIIEKNNTSGEEIGVILNFLLDMNLRELPKDYKNILKNKLN